jgi:chromate transporter
MVTSLPLEVLKTLAALWHVVAFAGGFAFVWQSYRALLGQIPHEPRWGKFIRKADIHLWLSGFVIIGLGILSSGLAHYLSNPKLWTKSLLILVWLIATQTMRRYAMPRFRAGNRFPMLLTAAISLGCWSYGAFLGVAKGLAYGSVPFISLASGFMLTLLVSLALTFLLSGRGQGFSRA